MLLPESRSVSHVVRLPTLKRIVFDLSRLEETADRSGVLAHVIVAVWRGDRRQRAGRYRQPGVLDHLRLPGTRPLIVARGRRSALGAAAASDAGTIGKPHVPVMAGAGGREAGRAHGRQSCYHEYALCHSVTLVTLRRRAPTRPGHPRNRGQYSSASHQPPQHLQHLGPIVRRICPSPSP